MVAVYSASPTTRVYVAGPLNAKAAVVTIVRFLQEKESLEVVSRWHELPAEITSADPTDLGERRRLNDANIHDIKRAELMVAWTMSGTPRATYSEIGYALAKGKTVFWIQGHNHRGANLFDAHHRVKTLTHYRLLWHNEPITNAINGAVSVIQELIHIGKLPPYYDLHGVL